MDTLSPCIKHCLLDPEERICAGCGRNLGEIAGWSRMSDAERRDVMAALPERLAGLKRRLVV